MPKHCKSKVSLVPMTAIISPEEIRGSFEMARAFAQCLRIDGIRDPLDVVATEQGFVVIHGKRRWLAALMLGLTMITVKVHIDLS